MNQSKASWFSPAGMLPALQWLRSYDRTWLRGDVIAGITLAAYLLPAGLGDASLANLPPEAGLYACLFAGSGLLAVLQFAAHGHHRHVRHFAARRRVARRDRRRRPGPVRRTRRGHGLARGAHRVHRLAGPGRRDRELHLRKRHGRVQVRRGALSRQHAIAEAVRHPRRARRFLGEQPALPRASRTRPIPRRSPSAASRCCRARCSARSSSKNKPVALVRRGRRHRGLGACSASRPAA